MRKLILMAIACYATTLAFAQRNRPVSEIFIQIERPGNYTVYLDDEFIGSAKGFYRFYDVYNTAPKLSIMQNNQVIFKKTIQTIAGQRLLLSYNSNRLILLEQTAINNTDFNTTPTYIPAYPAHNEVMSAEAFQRFYTLFKNEAFDSGKSKLISAILKNNCLLTSQIKPLLSAFDFDDKKLQMAKDLYKSTADQENYFTLADVFAFPSYKDRFLDEIAKK